VRLEAEKGSYAIGLTSLRINFFASFAIIIMISHYFWHCWWRAGCSNWFFSLVQP